MQDIIKVNQERLAVIIGSNGNIKKEIERKTKTRLEIDSTYGEITILCDNSFFEIHLAKKVIQAIARGFSPEHAFLLLKDNYEFEVISLSNLVKNSKQRYTQVKGRVIGREGRIKKIIEKKFNCKLSVYGKTVSIIGDQDKIKDARESVEKIILGAKHSSIVKGLKHKYLTEGYKLSDNSEKIDDVLFD